eukprot:887336-Amphidinium_carterae.1
MEEWFWQYFVVAAKPGSGRLTQAAITQSTGALGLDHLPDEVAHKCCCQGRHEQPHENQALANYLSVMFHVG